MKNLCIYIIISFSIFISCMNDAQWYDHQEHNEPDAGVFVVNEGNFLYENASLSFYKPDSSVVLNDVFFQANNAPLGDVAQSMTIRDSLGYIVINNSGKVYIINLRTFEFEGKITGLSSPRYMHFISDQKAYITDIYGKSITIVNPITRTITGYIDVDNHSGQFYQHSTEQMVQYNEFVFVNCWSYDNQILVINSQTDEVVDSIITPIQPRAMVMDKNEFLWVITDGGFQGSVYGHEQPALVKIDTETRQIVSQMRFDISTSPADLAINATLDTLYFINGDVFRYPVNQTISPKLFLESPYQGSYDRGFSALGIDPHTNEIYVADAIDNVQRGVVYRVKPDQTVIDTFKVGIIPTDFCFK